MKQTTYKYHKTIIGGAEKLIDGLENIEMFLDDNDDWNFHDSEIRAFNYNAKDRELTVTVEPIGFDYSNIECEDRMIPLLDFHFIGVSEIYMNYIIPEYIYEIEISRGKNWIQCWFNGCCIKVISIGLTVDKPRFVPEETDL